MTPPWVVPSLDVGKQGQPRLGVALEATPIDQFALEAGEEAFGHRVVVGVADAAHRRADTHLLATLAERDRCTANLDRYDE